MTEAEQWTRRAELLLAGPRSRSLCLLLSEVWLDARATAQRLANALGAIDPVALNLGKRTLIDGVAEAVEEAMYWQEPDGDDLLLAEPAVVDALRPVASAAVRAPAAQMWAAPLDPADQHFVSWLWKRKQSRADPPRLSGAAEMREAWLRAAHEEEQHAARERPADFEANHTGSWWSTPTFSGLVSTGPGLGDGSPSQLRWIEDSLGMRRARVARLRAGTGIRVFEISGPDALVDLVERFPLAMDRARRHDWFRASNGVRGPWLIPNWAAIGEQYDAVHLSVLGYLSTAGRALPVGDAYTMLAGWEPAETWWLNDVLTQATEPVTWKQKRSGRWRPVDP